MELHDGFEMIEAIEYQPIKQLTLENFSPGCKVGQKGKIHFSLFSSPITLGLAIIMLGHCFLSASIIRANILSGWNVFIETLQC